MICTLIMRGGTNRGALKIPMANVADVYFNVEIEVRNIMQALWKTTNRLKIIKKLLKLENTKRINRKNT